MTTPYPPASRHRFQPPAGHPWALWARSCHGGGNLPRA